MPCSRSGARRIFLGREDRIVFAGFGIGPPDDDSLFVANRIEPQRGLADLAARRRFAGLNLVNTPLAKPSSRRSWMRFVASRTIQIPVRSRVRWATSSSTKSMIHRRPSCFRLDRITPLLKGGRLLRSGKMDAKRHRGFSLWQRCRHRRRNAANRPVPSAHDRRQVPVSGLRAVRPEDQGRGPATDGWFQCRPKAAERKAEAQTLELASTKRAAARAVQEIKDLV